jgi:sugar lactone lactonase YvrE
MTLSLRLSVFLLITGLLISYSVRSQTVSTFASGITTPAGLAFDSNGNLYVAQSVSNLTQAEIKKVTPAGTVTTFVASATAATAAKFLQPTGVAVDASNNVYFATGNTNRTIRKVSPAGIVSSFADIGTATSSYIIGELVFGPDGNLYAAQNVNPQRVLQISNTGTVNTYVSQTAAGYAGVYGTPYGAAFWNGQLYYSDNRPGAPYARIFKVLSPDNITAVPVTGVSLNQPSGLAFATNGDLYVANTGTNSILKITQAGVATTFLSAAQVGAATGTNLSKPTDLAFDASGNLYISDQNNNRIVKVSLVTTTLTGFAASPAQVCAGQPTTFTATVGGLTSGTYNYTITNGSSSSVTVSNISFSTTAISQTLTASGSGPRTFTLTVSTGNTSLTQATGLTVNAPPVAALLTSASAVCPGAVITLNTSVTAGSSSSFQYAFNNGIPQASSSASVTPGLGINTYQVIVTDGNGCTALSTASVRGNASPTPSLVVSEPITCTANAILTADGGSTDSPFSYTFTNPAGITISGGSGSGTSATATASSEGTYTVQVANASGCISSTTANVVSNTITPENLTLSSNGTLTCSQTSVNLTAGSSTPSVSYSFTGQGIIASNGNIATVNQSGSFTVTATGTNGCTATQTTQVTSNTTAPNATLGNSGPITANQPTATLTASGGNTYAFSAGATQQGGPSGNTATVTTPGNYQVTVTNSGNGCSATASTMITGAVSSSSCRNGSGVITVVASGSPVKYEWYRNNINSARLTENPAQVRGTSTSSLTLVNQQVTADYYVRVTDVNGTVVVYGPFRFTVNLGCNIYARQGTEEVGLRISLLGNPIQGEQLRATISGAAGKALNVQLLDLSGRPIRQQFWQQAETAQSVEWNLSGQSSGVYLLQANTEADATTQAQRHDVKLIKQ